MMMIDSSLVH